MAILNRFYLENTKFNSKIIIHILLALILVDLIWLVVIMPYWNSKSTTKNAYWDSLSGVHTFTLILAFIELFLKAGMAALMLYEFRKAYPLNINELFNFNYQLPVQTGLIYNTNAPADGISKKYFLK